MGGVGIPTNIWELRQREEAVCQYDFESTAEGTDHHPIKSSVAVLNAWRLQKPKHLVSPSPFAT
jgi:hypothetical protein